MRRRLFVVAAAMAATSPALILRGQGTSEMPHGDLKIDCGECHDPESWTPVVKPPTFRHEHDGLPARAGAPRRRPAVRCHRALVFTQVGTACADCHKDAHRGELGSRCEACHTPTTWSNQRDMFRVHDRTRFPLFAAHARLDCTACHRNQRPYQYANTPAECGACHLETWQQTTEPAPRRVRLLDALPGLPQRHLADLAGRGLLAPRQLPADRRARRARLRELSRERDLPGAVDARARRAIRRTTPRRPTRTTPPRASRRRARAATRSRPGVRRRSTTAGRGFPLTGAHVRAECASCHPGGRYTGTPSDCYACHQADYAGTTNPSHQAAGFPTQCQGCHNTSAWRPASFDHDGRYFPIYSGAHRGRWSSCGDCHQLRHYRTPIDCIPAIRRIGRRPRITRRRGGYGFPSAACYRCHSTTALAPGQLRAPRRAL